MNLKILNCLFNPIEQRDISKDPLLTIKQKFAPFINRNPNPLIISNPNSLFLILDMLDKKEKEELDLLIQELFTILNNTYGEENQLILSNISKCQQTDPPDHQIVTHPNNLFCLLLNFYDNQDFDPLQFEKFLKICCNLNYLTKQKDENLKYVLKKLNKQSNFKNHQSEILFKLIFDNINQVDKFESYIQLNENNTGLIYGNWETVLKSISVEAYSPKISISNGQTMHYRIKITQFTNQSILFRILQMNNKGFEYQFSNNKLFQRVLNYDNHIFVNHSNSQLIIEFDPEKVLGKEMTITLSQTNGNIFTNNQLQFFSSLEGDNKIITQERQDQSDKSINYILLCQNMNCKLYSFSFINLLMQKENLNNFIKIFSQGINNQFNKALNDVNNENELSKMQKNTKSIIISLDYQNQYNETILAQPNYEFLCIGNTTIANSKIVNLNLNNIIYLSEITQINFSKSFNIFSDQINIITYLSNQLELQQIQALIYNLKQIIISIQSIDKNLIDLQLDRIQFFVDNCSSEIQSCFLSIFILDNRLWDKIGYKFIINQVQNQQLKTDIKNDKVSLFEKMFIVLIEQIKETSVIQEKVLCFLPMIIEIFKFQLCGETDMKMLNYFLFFQVDDSNIHMLILNLMKLIFSENVFYLQKHITTDLIPVLIQQLNMDLKEETVNMFIEIIILWCYRSDYQNQTEKDKQLISFFSNYLDDKGNLNASIKLITKSILIIFIYHFMVKKDMNLLNSSSYVSEYNDSKSDVISLCNQLDIQSNHFKDTDLPNLLNTNKLRSRSKSFDEKLHTTNFKHKNQRTWSSIKNGDLDLQNEQIDISHISELAYEVFEKFNKNPSNELDRNDKLITDRHSHNKRRRLNIANWFGTNKLLKSNNFLDESEQALITNPIYKSSLKKSISFTSNKKEKRLRKNSFNQFDLVTPILTKFLDKINSEIKSNMNIRDFKANDLKYNLNMNTIYKDFDKLGKSFHQLYMVTIREEVITAKFQAKELQNLSFILSPDNQTDINQQSQKLSIPHTFSKYTDSYFKKNYTDQDLSNPMQLDNQGRVDAEQWRNLATTHNHSFVEYTNMNYDISISDYERDYITHLILNDCMDYQEFSAVQRCMNVTLSNIRLGYLVVTNLHLYFVQDCNKNEHVHLNHLALFASVLPSDTSRVLKFPLSLLRQVIRRKFMHTEIAIEIFFKDDSSMQFVIPKKVIYFCNDLYTIREKQEYDFEIMQQVDIRNFTSTHSIVDDWVDWRISNLDFVSYLNWLAGRSQHDLAQYPFAPWVVNVQSGEKINLDEKVTQRDLACNMGMQPCSPGRIQVFRQRYLEQQEYMDHETTPYLFGSFYSHPGIVTQYNIRLQPFNHLAIELQGGQFDQADRLFFDMQITYGSCTNDTSDVRELLLEMYTCASVQKNLNNLDLGILRSKEKINNVKIPRQGKNDANYFIRIMRCAFESDNSALHLEKWIDLHFGYSTRGQEALKHENVQHPQVQDSKFLKQSRDRNELFAQEQQVQSQGQVPTQIFKKKMQSRKKKSKNLNSILQNFNKIAIYKPNQDHSLNQLFIPNVIICNRILCSNNPQGVHKNFFENNQSIMNEIQQVNNLLTKENWKQVSLMNEIYKRDEGNYNKDELINLSSSGLIELQKINNSHMDNVPYSLTNYSKIQINFKALFKYNFTEFNQLFENRIFNQSALNPKFVSQFQPVIQIQSKNIIVLGGIKQNSLLIQDISQQNLSIAQRFSELVTVLCADQKGDYLYCGLENGQIFLMKFKSRQPQLLEHQRTLHFGSSQINQMNFDNMQRMAVWCDIEGYVYIWKHLQSDTVAKPLRVFKSKQNRAQTYALLSKGSPLQVILQSQWNSLLEVITIEGDPIMHETVEEGLINPKVLEDLNCNNMIAQSNRKGNFYIRFLPNITRCVRFMIEKDTPIVRFNMSEDSKQIFACGLGGKMNILTEKNTFNNV